MPYQCSQFCADIKFHIRFDNRFDIKLEDSFHVNNTIHIGSKLRCYGKFNMEAISKSDIKSAIKSDIRFDISIKPTTVRGTSLAVACIFFTPFPKTIYVLLPLALCMACIQERLLIKSGL